MLVQHLMGYGNGSFFLCTEQPLVAHVVVTEGESAHAHIRSVTPDNGWLLLGPNIAKLS
jgi:hypothetical protein